MRKLVISMGYGLAYLTVIGFYSYLKFNVPEDGTLKLRKNQEKRRYQASPIRNLTKKNLAKSNSGKKEQSYADSLAQQKNKMRYN